MLVPFNEALVVLQAQKLCGDFSKDDIMIIVVDLGNSKASGLDGITFLYQSM